MEKLQALITQLQAIAKKNDDEFHYRIDISASKGALRFHFSAVETADNHSFTDGWGNTIEEAVGDAADGVTDACKNWGYSA